MDRSMQGMIMGFIAFIAFIVVFGLSMLKVSQTVIGAVLVIAILLSAVIMRRIK
ncbi:hypothetical protein [Companilactobacillus pabuli]|uniref:hypothetical protein n=1 Tax=Companilactobacillus pabuli TaxID=2714036 RepID=UPI002416FEA2|nr:hypothetical protein [Companilactobacillus pabuli]MDG5114035.1 hypothetical protein [Companilactobacillus pabuli]